jgi:hypothetical protein
MNRLEDLACDEEVRAFLSIEFEEQAEARYSCWGDLTDWVFARRHQQDGDPQVKAGEVAPINEQAPKLNDETDSDSELNRPISLLQADSRDSVNLAGRPCWSMAVSQARWVRPLFLNYCHGGPPGERT